MKTSKKPQTAIDNIGNLCYNTAMTNNNTTTKEKKMNMNIDRFLLHITYSTACPDFINPVRWAAMLTWATKRGWNVL